MEIYPRSLEEQFEDHIKTVGSASWLKMMGECKGNPLVRQRVMQEYKSTLAALENMVLDSALDSSNVMQGQGKEEALVPVGPLNNRKFWEVTVEKTLEEYGQRLTALEKNQGALFQTAVQKESAKEAVKQPVEKAPSATLEQRVCRVCQKEFPTVKARSKHFMAEHAIKKESAWSSDFKTMVKTDKTGHFLGKSSGPTKSKQLNQASKSKAKANQSTEVAECLLRMESLVEKFSKASESMLKAMAGPTSATAQN